MSIRHASVAAAAILLVACASSPDKRDAERAAARKAAELNTSMGSEYLVRGEYEVALEKLKKAVSADPNYAPAHTVLAVLYERIGEEERAARHYRQAVKVAPDSGDVNNNYGVFLCQTGKSQEALAYFARAVQDPFYRTPEIALANAGACELQAGNLDKAEKFLRQSLEYNAEFADALLPLARISYRKEEFMRARAFLQRFEDVSEATAESLYLGFQVEQRLGDAEEARGYADRLRARYPDSAEAQGLMAGPGS